MSMTRPVRDYGAIARSLRGVAGSRANRMEVVADTLWRHLHDKDVSWCGFYTASEGDEEMILGACRNSPACSPIALSGICGRSWLDKAPIVAADLSNLGDRVIKCDPRDLSEVVVPLFDQDGTCWGVLDLDSHDRNSFNDSDAKELHKLMIICGLSWDGHAERRVKHF